MHSLVLRALRKKGAPASFKIALARSILLLARNPSTRTRDNLNKTSFVYIWKLRSGINVFLKNYFFPFYHFYTDVSTNWEKTDDLRRGRKKKFGGKLSISEKKLVLKSQIVSFFPWATQMVNPRGIMIKYWCIFFTAVNPTYRSISGESFKITS